MKDLIQHQLKQSVATLQTVLADERIHETLLQIGEVTAAAMRGSGKLLVAGNGGSAADAQHLAAEFVNRLTVTRPALRAIALTTDTSILTSIGNDFDYDQIFERQVEALGQKGDVLLGISTSGNSRNLVRAFQQARRQGIVTAAFTGRGGGKMAEFADFLVPVPSSVTMNIQESHLALEHIFCMIVERLIFGMDFGRQPQVLSE